MRSYHVAKVVMGLVLLVPQICPTAYSESLQEKINAYLEYGGSVDHLGPEGVADVHKSIENATSESRIYLMSRIKTFPEFLECSAHDRAVSITSVILYSQHFTDGISMARALLKSASSDVYLAREFPSGPINSVTQTRRLVAKTSVFDLRLALLDILREKKDQTILPSALEMLAQADESTRRIVIDKYIRPMLTNVPEYRVIIEGAVQNEQSVAYSNKQLLDLLKETQTPDHSKCGGREK